MAITKERKTELVDEYSKWISQSKALVLIQYTGLNMKDMDALRSKVREVGGEFHIIKNTLGKLAFDQAGLPIPENFLEGSTAVGFAFEDAANMVKAINEFTRNIEFLKVKGGYLDKQPLNADQVSMLANLPTLPVLRSQLLGVLLAPASKLARTLAEPGRQIAAVIKAYAEPAAAS